MARSSFGTPYVLRLVFGDISLQEVMDRRVCFREGAEVGEEWPRCDGNSGASALILLRGLEIRVELFESGAYLAAVGNAI
jgi:hypothetical protein